MSPATTTKDKPTTKTTTAKAPDIPSPVPSYRWHGWKGTGVFSSRSGIPATIHAMQDTCRRHHFPTMLEPGEKENTIDIYVLFDGLDGSPPKGSADLKNFSKIPDADLPPKMRENLARLRELDRPEDRMPVTVEHLDRWRRELTDIESRSAALIHADLNRSAEDIADEQARLERTAAILRQRLKAGAEVQAEAEYRDLFPKVAKLKARAAELDAEIKRTMDQAAENLKPHFDPEWWENGQIGGMPVRHIVLKGVRGMMHLVNEQTALEPTLRREQQALQQLAGKASYLGIQRRVARRREMLGELGLL